MSILKRIGTLALGLAMLAGTCAYAEGTESPKRIDAPEEAEAFVRTLLGEDPASLDGKYLMSAQLNDYLQKNGGFAGLAQSLAALGPAAEICSAYETDAGGMKGYRIPCRFAAMPLDLLLTLDQDGAVAGLTTQLFTGGEPEEKDGDQPFTETELALPVPEMNGELPGTLTLPEGDGPFPAVILIQGSGPSDRDESIYALKPFRDIAEGLAEKGIAVYRFDKRTYVYGKELAGDKSATLMEESVLDAAAAVQLLAEQEKIDSSRIWVLGHSLGGTAIPAIDRELKEMPVRAHGYILMAAGARRLDETMKEQYAFLAELDPTLKAQADAVTAELAKLENPEALTDDDEIAGVYAAYWKWLLEYDMTGLAAEISVPCLVLQGEEDYQSTMEDFTILRDALGAKDNRTFKSYPGLTHVFMEGKKADGPAAYMGEKHVSGEVIADIADFILEK